MQESYQIRGGECPDCGDRTALSIYSDGHTYCHKCGTYSKGEGTIAPSPTTTNPTSRPITDLAQSFRPLSDRMITKETAEKFQVGVIVDADRSVLQHYYPYFDESGVHIANKVRGVADKSFHVEGPITRAGLFGQQVFPAGCAKQITVVEGECDAMAAYELMGSKYPVVSLRNGADGAVKDFRKAYDYLNSFDQIVLCFDNDKPGQEAVGLVASMFEPGKVRHLKLDLHKDPNEYLRKHQAKEFVKEWWDAPTHMPEGLVMAKDLLTDVLTPKKFETIPYPYARLQAMTYGIRLSELVVITAETGIGKSTVLNEVEYAILFAELAKERGYGLGLLRLEEDKVDAVLGLMSIHANKPLHLPDVREGVSEEELKKYFDETVNNDRIIIWDHFGSNNIGTVLDRIRHMAAMGCKYIILDHLSIIVSDQEGGDERKQLDEITTKLKMLCMEQNIAVFAVIHQNRAGQIRGTAGVEQLANMVFKLVRDKTDADPVRRNIMKLTIEKNRFCGRTGPALWLWYNPDTGRLVELNDDQIAEFEAGEKPTMQEEWE